MRRAAYRFLWRGGLWLALLLLLVVTLYVSAGRILTPMLNAYRLEIQDWLGSQLEQQVHLGRLHAGWHGLSPRFYAEDVRIGEAEQPLQVERLHFRPDMLGSVLRGHWQLSAISLQGLDLELHEHADGWLLNGMELGEADSERDTDVLAMLEQASRIGLFSLVDARLKIRALDSAPFELRKVGLTLQSSGREHQLQAKLLLPDEQEVLLTATAKGVLSRWQEGRLNAYIQLPDSNWLQWLPEGWQSVLPADLALDEVRLGLQGWLTLEHSQIQQLVIASPEGRLQGQWQGQELDLGLGRLLARLTEQDDQRVLWVPDLHIRWQSAEKTENLAFQMRQDTDQPWLQSVTDMAFPQLQLEPLLAAVVRYVPMPQLAKDILSELDFRGQLQNTRLRWRPGEHWQQQLEYDTNVVALDYSPWEDVPGATGIYGRLLGSLAGGELHLDSNAFSLHLRELFAEAWHYRTANARLTWSLNPQLDFVLTSPYLRVTGEEGQLAGDFVIDIPAGKDRESYMDLRVGMRDGHAVHKARYLPRVLQEEQPALWDWLHEAIREGDIHQGYFQYQGSLSAEAPPTARSISLYFDVSNAQLAYQPGWPLLEEGRAQVFVHDAGVEIDIEQGRILDTRVTAARAEVIYPPEGASALELTARLDSSVTDALHIVQRTPLSPQLPMLADWHGKGPLAGRLELRVPFADEESTRVKLDLQLKGNVLSMPELGLELVGLQGGLQIDSLAGMASDGLVGQFLDQSFIARMGLASVPGQWGSRVQVRGRMPVEHLARWLEYEQPLPATGSFAYQLDLSLLEQGSELAISSDLQGVRIDLPAPLGKPATQARSTDWHMTFDAPEQHYRLKYGEQLSALFAQSAKTGKLRGELVLGRGAARLSTAEGLQIRAAVGSLHGSDWLAALDTYLPATDGQGELVREVQLEAGVLEGFGIPLEQARLHLWSTSGSWLARLDSKQVTGGLQVPREGALKVHLDRVQLPAEMLSADEAADEPFRASQLPAMQVQIKQLELGEDILGELAFETRPDATGVSLEKIAANLKGLQVDGKLRWQESPVLRSHFQGELAGEQLDKILGRWGYAPSMTSEQFSIELDLQWPGSPQDFSAAALDGETRLRFRKGRLVTVDGSAQALRIFGLFNFDTIGRRLRLDFSDLWSKGLSFDRIDGVLDIKQGVFATRETLALEGVSSNLRISGQLDVPAGTLAADMEVAMPISRNLPLAAVAAGAPAVGGALFVIDRLIGDRFSRMAAVHYRISGDWQDPQISLARGADK